MRRLRGKQTVCEGLFLRLGTRNLLTQPPSFDGVVALDRFKRRLRLGARSDGLLQVGLVGCAIEVVRGGNTCQTLLGRTRCGVLPCLCRRERRRHRTLQLDHLVDSVLLCRRNGLVELRMQRLHLIVQCVGACTCL